MCSKNLVALFTSESKNGLVPDVSIACVFSISLTRLWSRFALNLLSIAGQRLVLNLRGFKVRTYGSRSLSAEVDRQLQLLTGTQVEWWSSSTNQSDSSRVGTRRKTAGDIDMNGFEP